MGPTEKQIARLTNTKSVISTRIGAVLNIGGSRLLYLLHVPSKTGLVESYIIVYPFLVVEPGQSECGYASGLTLVLTPYNVGTCNHHDCF
jgi:hypothetical protein